MMYRLATPVAPNRTKAEVGGTTARLAMTTRFCSGRRWVGASRGFGLPIPVIVTDANNMWVTASQDVAVSSKPTGTDPFIAGLDFGGFGYNGALNYSPDP